MEKRTAVKGIIIGLTAFILIVNGAWAAHLSIDGPARMDSIYIADSEGVIVADTNALDVGPGGISNLGTLTAVQGTIASEGDFQNGGTFVPGTSSVFFDGSGLQIISGENKFYNLTVNNSYSGDKPDDNDVDAETLTVSAGLAVKKGQFQPADGSQFHHVNIWKDGTLKPDADARIGVGGNWTNQGTFHHNNGSVFLNGKGQTIGGSTVFYNLSKKVVEADTLTFMWGGANATTVLNILNLEGAPGNPLVLQSDSEGSQWEIDPRGSRVIGYLSVKDSNNINGTPMDAVDRSCTNLGNNTNWLFDQLPEVTTLAVTGIETGTAVGNGRIVALGRPNPTAYGVCWNTEGNPTVSDQKTDEGVAAATGPFSTSMTGLSSGVTYYVRAYADNLVGTAYGNEVTFTTDSVPSVTTAAVSGITDTTAVSGGEVTSDGGETVTARGVCWSIAADPTTADSHTTDGSGAGSFTSTLTGLMPGTAYHVRAYAANSLGTTYGNNVMFTTGTVLPSVTTAAVSVVTETTAACGGNVVSDGGKAVTARGVCWSTSVNPTTADRHTTDGIGTGSFTSSLTGLEPNTSYHVRAYAANSKGTAYGRDLTFRTNGKVAVKIDLSGPSSVVVETVSTAFTVLSRDALGNVAALTEDTVVSLSSNTTGTAIFYSDGAGTREITSVTLEKGKSIAVFYYKDTRAGAPTVTATCVSGMALGSSSYKITVTDIKEAPVATLANSPSGLTNVTKYSVMVGGIGVVSYRYRVDSDAWSRDTGVVVPLKLKVETEGDHTLYVIGKDGSGLEQPEENATEADWSLDTTPPVATINNCPQGIIGVTAIDVVVGGEDVQFYKYRLDKGAWSVAYSVETHIRATGLLDGTHTLEVIGVDTPGNWQKQGDAATVSWTVDTTVPTAVLLNLPPAITNRTALDLTVSGEGVDAYKYSLDGGLTWTYGLVVEPIAQTGLSAGKRIIHVNGYNTTTNRWQDGLSGETIESATTYQWTIDVTPPPSVTTLSAAAGSPSTTVVRLSWPSVENGLKAYGVWYALFPITEENLGSATRVYCGMTPAPEGYGERLTITGLLPASTYYFAMKSTDAAGNPSGLSNNAIRTTTNTLPVIMDFALTGGGTSGDNSVSREIQVSGANYLVSAGDNILRFVSIVVAGSVFDVVTRAGTETRIFADVPEGAPAGTYRLRVVNKNGTSPLSSGSYTVTPASLPVPEVTDLSPVLGMNDEETTLTITGAHFSETVTDVVLATGAGAEVHRLTGVMWISGGTLTARVPAGCDEGQYNIQVHNPDGTYNLVSAVKFEVCGCVDLSTATGPMTTSSAAAMPADATIPVALKLCTDDREEVDPVQDNTMAVEVTLDPGTAIEAEEQGGTWADFTGTINPPRQVRPTSGMLSELGSDAVAFTMGADRKLRLKDGRTMLTTVDVVVLSEAAVPSLYYLEADGSLTLAGIDGVRNGLTYARGGTVLATQTGAPGPGYTTYTFGLLLDHMSTFAAGTTSPPPTPSGGGGGGGCFIDTMAH